MKTVGEVLKLSCDFVQSKNKNVPRRDIEDLIANRLRLKRLQLYVNFDKPVQEEELVSLREGLKRLCANEPVQYILGEVEFSGCRIKVTKDVLIPRVETEVIVERIIQELKQQDLKGKKLLDLCSGSGYIGIAIKKACPDLDVILSDISKEACALAKETAEKNNVAVTILQGDFLAPMKGKIVDFLVCNPPYISEEEYAILDPAVKDFEPKLALVSGKSGLEFYERLAKEAKSFVTKKLFLEIGATQKEAVTKLFEIAGFSSIQVEKDLAGHDRLVSVEV